MCRFFSSLLLALYGLFAQLAATPLSIEIHGKAAVLMNGKNKKVLFSKEKDLLVYPASTTKVATALYLLERFPHVLNEIAVANQEALATIAPQAKRESNYRSPPYWLESDGSHMGIKKGEELIIKDLLYAMLIRSPNDAANVIAAHVGKTIPNFMEGLNDYLKELGCSQSHFMNPHGLHHPMHRTTAVEMAWITSQALNHALFREIVSKGGFTFPQTNLEHERALVQTNHLMKRGNKYYPCAIGVKTGTTKAAGKCLIAAAEKNGRLLVATLFGYTQKDELYGDAIKLFEKAFAEKKHRAVLLPAGSHSFTGEVRGKKRQLLVSVPSGVNYDFYPSEKEPVQVRLRMDEIILPVEKGAKIGQLCLVTQEGQLVAEFPFFTEKRLRAPYLATISTLVWQKRLFISIALIVVIILYYLRRKKRF